MSVQFDRFVGPFRKVWSAVGRSLVLDAGDRQVVRPGSDLGTASWHDEKSDWERLAPIVADAVPLYEQAESLAARLEGPDVRTVDGRIVVEASDFAGLLDVLDRIRAGMPKRPDPAPDEDEPASGPRPR